MRHGKKINHLSRQTAHRKSMLANMACSLIEHKRINTTVAKAKALKQFVEPMITKSKEDTTHNRRIVMSRLRQKDAVLGTEMSLCSPSTRTGIPTISHRRITCERPSSAPMPLAGRASN